MDEDKKIENPNLENQGNEQEVENENLNLGSEDVDTFDTLKAKNKSLYEQLKKAKGFTRGEDGKWVKKETPQTPEPKKEELKPQSSDLDYGQKAYLRTEGFKTEAEFDLMKKAMKDSGKTLEQVLANPYFQADLEILRTSNATITNNRGQGGEMDKVEYWLAKGELPPASEFELRKAVVNARMKKESKGGAFYNQK